MYSGHRGGGRGYQGHGRGDRRGQYDQFNQGYSRDDGYRRADGHQNAFGSRTQGGWSGGRGSGRSSRGRGRGSVPSDLDEQNQEVEFLWQYPDHKQDVTCMTFDAANSLLYTGCKDGHVNVYTYTPNERKRRFQENRPFKNQLPGSVSALVCLPGGLLVVACTMASGGQQIGGLHIANTQQTLQLHQGRIESMAVVPSLGMIFTGGVDGVICGVGLDAAGALVQKGSLTAQQGGHNCSVTYLAEYLLSGTQLLLSGDIQGTLKVWDIAGTLLQTIERAHNSAITGFISFQDFIITASLDGLVRIWQASQTPAPNALFMPQPIAEYRPTGPNNMPEANPAPILALHGVCSSSGTPWLLVSRQNTNTVEFVQLTPQFEWGGTLARCLDARCIITLDELPDGERMILVGTSNGAVKSYRWKALQ